MALSRWCSALCQASEKHSLPERIKLLLCFELDECPCRLLPGLGQLIYNCQEKSSSPELLDVRFCSVGRQFWSEGWLLCISKLLSTDRNDSMMRKRDIIQIRCHLCRQNAPNARCCQDLWLDSWNSWRYRIPGKGLLIGKVVLCRSSVSLVLTYCCTGKSSAEDPNHTIGSWKKSLED